MTKFLGATLVVAVFITLLAPASYAQNQIDAKAMEKLDQTLERASGVMLLSRILSKRMGVPLEEVPLFDRTVRGQVERHYKKENGSILAMYGAFGGTAFLYIALYQAWMGNIENSFRTMSGRWVLGVGSAVLTTHLVSTSFSALSGSPNISSSLGSDGHFLTGHQNAYQISQGSFGIAVSSWVDDLRFLPNLPPGAIVRLKEALANKMFQEYQASGYDLQGRIHVDVLQEVLALEKEDGEYFIDEDTSNAITEHRRFLSYLKDTADFTPLVAELTGPEFTDESFKQTSLLVTNLRKTVERIKTDGRDVLEARDDIKKEVRILDRKVQDMEDLFRDAQAERAKTEKTKKKN